MGYFTTAIALAAGIAGLLIALYIARSVLSPVISLSKLNPFKRKNREESTLHNKGRILKEVDKFLEIGDIKQCLTLLKESFVLEHIKSTPYAIELARMHNLAALSRLSEVARKAGISIKNLPYIEELLDSRGKLLVLYFDTLTLRDNIRLKRKKERGKMASIKRDEFANKLKEIKGEIFSNKELIRRALKEAFSLISDSKIETGITYH
ncbi:MAG: hypothetical protein D6808_05810 [Candidatus Dadabacteria bacterium]|nr:MAG: hypothetical protein D6808_05810 [Candidatus Dadabacteria bacterium]